MSVDPRRGGVLCGDDPRCYRQCRCSRWPDYKNRFGNYVVPHDDAQEYYEKVLSYGPIAYWPLWETAGVTAECLVNPLQNGTYARNVAVMGTGTGIGDGYTAPNFDGTNDVVNIYSAALAAAYSGSELTLGAWAKATNWVNGIEIVRITGRIAPTVDRFYIYKDNAADRGVFYYMGNSVADATAEAGGQTTTAWRFYALTVSAAADELKGYVNTGQIGATQNTLGAWQAAGALVNTACCIGAQTTVAASPWLGQIAHVMLFGSALALPAIADLATV